MNSPLYDITGYIYSPNFFSEEELVHLEYILLKFHTQWLIDQQTAYTDGLINSHSLTGSSVLSKEDKLSLFQFVSQPKIASIIELIFTHKARFLNTQLFFDPVQKDQPNYWHRDVQYTGATIEEQQQSIVSDNVVHFRVPLKSEQGIELIPGSHNTWDQAVEQDTRLSQNGRKPNDNLSRGKVIPLERCDLLVFSANMIHRGLYGNDRFAFDFIYLDDHPKFAKFIDSNNQPTEEELKHLNRELF